MASEDWFGFIAGAIKPWFGDGPYSAFHQGFFPGHGEPPFLRPAVILQLASSFEPVFGTGEERHLKKILWGIIPLLVVGGLASIPVSVRQGMNYTLQENRIPLGWKVIHFLSRHHRMQMLTAQIVGKEISEEKKALDVYDWVRANIYRGIPSGLPVVDDHVLDIAIRRYGSEDQIADLFTALCSYAGLEARWDRVSVASNRWVAAIPVVNISHRLIVMDPYRGFISRDPSGQFVDLAVLQKRLRGGLWDVGGMRVRELPYEQVLLAMPTEFGMGMDRGSSQMPFRRLSILFRDKWSRMLGGQKVQ